MLPDVIVPSLRAHEQRQAQERLLAGSKWLDHDLVFSTSIGTPISPSNLVRRNFKPLLKRAGTF